MPGDTLDGHEVPMLEKNPFSKGPHGRPMPWPRGCPPALAAVILGLSLQGCPTPVASPQDTLKAYVAALDAKDYDRAYALMSKAFRAEYDRDEFVSQHRSHPEEVQRNIRELKQGPVKLALKGEVRYGDGDRLHLMEENGVWRISLDPVSFYSQKTPRETLQSFVRALERRRFDVLLRFVPSKWGKVMTLDDMKAFFGPKQLEATKLLIRNLKANLENKIDLKGDEAEMLYGDSFKVQFLREEGVWKIVDAD